QVGLGKRRSEGALGGLELVGLSLGPALHLRRCLLDRQAARQVGVVVLDVAALAGLVVVEPIGLSGALATYSAAPEQGTPADREDSGAGAGPGHEASLIRGHAASAVLARRNQAAAGIAQ